jgi:hypothetical protein
MASQLAPRLPSRLTPDEERLLDLYRHGRVTPPPRAPGWRVAIEALVALRSLVTLALLGLLVLLAASLLSVSGGLQQRFSSAVSRTGQSLTAAGQAIGDVFNPRHPPRYSITQDTEFSTLQTLRAGDTLGQSAEYVYTLADVRRREDAGGAPDFAQYAVLERRYRTARETKVLGLTVFTDRGEQQYVLDRGVSFRIGAQLYKVNWISAVERQMAVGVYRNPDQFGGRLAFDSA